MFALEISFSCADLPQSFYGHSLFCLWIERGCTIDRCIMRNQNLARYRTSLKVVRMDGQNCKHVSKELKLDQTIKGVDHKSWMASSSSWPGRYSINFWWQCLLRMHTWQKSQHSFPHADKWQDQLIRCWYWFWICAQSHFGLTDSSSRSHCYLFNSRILETYLSTWKFCWRKSMSSGKQLAFHFVHPYDSAFRRPLRSNLTSRAGFGIN